MPKVQEVVQPDGSLVRRKPLPGDLRWDGTEWRRWSGRGWMRAAYSLSPRQLRDPAGFVHRPPVDPHRVRRAVTLAVEDQMATQAATVVFAGPTGVVLAYRRPVNHLAHGALTLFTGGIWGFVWLVMVLSRRDDRVRLEPDRWGNVWPRPLRSV